MKQLDDRLENMNYAKIDKLYGLILPLIFWVWLSSNSTANAQAPSIIIQPAGQSSAVGGTIQFTVSATGGGSLIYQWRKNSTNLSNGTFSGRATVGGATTATMTLAGVTTSDQGNYTCFVTNTSGSVTSSLATLAIVLPPTITTQPNTVATNAGATVSFSVVAAGTTPFSYQWYDNGALITGATLNSFTISGVFTSDAGTYTVRVSNSAGTITSSNAVLTVGNLPSLTLQPNSLIVTQGQTASFSASASGDQPIYYYWRKNGAYIPGATNTSFAIANTVATDAATYTIVASNSIGTGISTGAVLTVYYPPSISLQPSGQTVGVGSNFTINVTATGNPALAYQWCTNGVVIVGATASTYTVNGATTSNSGLYDVVVSNIVGSVTSSVALVNVVFYPPKITTQPVGGNWLAGSSLYLNASATGTAPLSWQWRKGDIPILGANSNTYILNGIQLTDAGSYDVVVTNMGGSITSSVAVVYAGYAPAITQQPISITTNVGSTIVFTCAATGPLPMTYQWFLNGQALLQGIQIPAQTNATLQLTNIQIGNIGFYYAVVANNFGSISSSICSLHISPSIAVQPINQVIMPGSAVTLTVYANGEPPLNYQWQMNGTNLSDGYFYSGSISNTLNILAAPTNTLGNYTVTVSNSYGSITSALATVSYGFQAVSIFNFTGIIQPYIVPIGVTNLGLIVCGGNGASNGSGIGGFGGLGGCASGIVSATQSNELFMAVGSSAPSAQGGVCPITNYNGGNGSSGSMTNYGGGGGAATVVVFPDNSSLICGGGGGGGRNFALGGTFYNGGNGGSSIIVVATNNQTAGYSGVSTGGGGGANAGFGSSSWTGGPGYSGGSNGSNILNYGYSTGGGGAGGSFLPTNYLYGATAWVFTNAPQSEVNGSITIIANPIPFISQQPTPQSALAGSPAQFNLNVTSPVPLAFQWYFNGAAVAGGTGATLPFLAVTPQNSGNYYAVVSNAFSTVTSSVVSLTVNIPVYITSQPQSQTVQPGGTATFGVLATGTPSLAFQWFKQQSNQAAATPLVSGGFFLGANIVNGGSGYLAPPNVIVSGGGGTGALATAIVNSGTVTAINVINPGSGYTSQPAIIIDPPTAPLSAQTNATLNINNATTSDAGKYFVVVSNNYGSATSSIVSLTVNVPVYIIAQPQSLTVSAGSNASFSVTTGGQAPFNYQWYVFPPKNTTAMATALVQNGFVYGATIISGGQGYSSIPNVQFTGGGGSGATATAVVSNGIVVSLNVINPGSGYTNAPIVQFDSPGAVILNGSTNQALNIANVSTNDAGAYFVVAANAYGSATSTQAVLSVLLVAGGSPPTITSQPASQNVLVGHTTVFNVSATGTSTLCYQWIKNGTNLPSATLPSLSFPIASTNDTGSYLVIVTNNYGSATSSIASLVVGLPPQNLNITSSSGNSIQLQMPGTPLFPYTLQTASNLVAPIQWVPVLTIVANTNGAWQFTETNFNGTQKYYRVTSP